MPVPPCKLLICVWSSAHQRHAAVIPQSIVSAWVDGAQRDVLVVRRETLLAGQRFTGPAIVSQDDCTTCIPTGMQVEVDTFGNLVITPLQTNTEEVEHGY
jgi:N-methylhydantoinase A